jgi:hypothetical protein
VHVAVAVVGLLIVRNVAKCIYGKVAVATNTHPALHHPPMRHNPAAVTFLDVISFPCLQTISNQYQSCDTWEGGYRRTEIERQKVHLSCTRTA